MSRSNYQYATEDDRRYDRINDRMNDTRHQNTRPRHQNTRPRHQNTRPRHQNTRNDAIMDLLPPALLPKEEPKKIKIQTISPNFEYYIEFIKNEFGLYSYPFDGIDDELLYLTFSAKCNKDLSKYYGTCDHQSLEFIGDKMLYSIVCEILYSYFGLTADPGSYTKLTNLLTNNKILTDLMLISDSCEYVNIAPYNIINSAQFHNSCADSFEALVGALYIHLRNFRPELNPLYELKNWLYNKTYYPLVMAHVFSNFENLKQIPLFVKNSIEKMRYKLDTHIIGLEKRINQKPQFSDLVELDPYKKEEYELSKYALIVYDTASIEDIYMKLDWEYSAPIPYSRLEYELDSSLDDVWYYQYHDGILYGIGQTSEEAIKSTISSLKLRGYIIHLSDVDFEFEDFSNMLTDQTIVDRINKLSLEKY